MELLFGYSSPRYNSLENLEEYDANSPSIATDTVYVILEGLRRHVDGRSHIVILVFLDLLTGNSEPEIAYLVGRAFEEYVCWLNISVKIARSVHIDVSLDNLL